MDERHPVVVIGAGIAGVSLSETLATLCPDVPIQLISASSVLKVAENVLETGYALHEFDVVERPQTYIEDKFKNITVRLDQVTHVDTDQQLLRLHSGTSQHYSFLCICTGGRPQLIGHGPHIIGIRDTETVEDLQRRLATAKRIILVGNGGIATELVYAIRNCEIIWAIRDKDISSTFFDAVAARFFESKLDEISSDKELADTKGTPMAKRWKKYAGDGDSNQVLGSALGPDWLAALNQARSDSNHRTEKNVTVERETDVKRIYENDEADPGWKIYVELSNGQRYGADFIVSATGVTPNSSLLTTAKVDLAADGGIKVNQVMHTNIENIYAAGDVCTVTWPLAEHWFPMKLWTQARQMGVYAGHCVASKFLPDYDPLFRFNFEVFTHVTKFFGFKVILIGLFNGQKLGNAYEALYRVTEGHEYIKVLIKDGKVKGAVLIGETDLEETFENLIHNQIDVSHYGADLLNPDVDIEDYFD